MGWLNRVEWLLSAKKIHANIVIVGLANSGKSTIMHQLKPREVPMHSIMPSIPIGCPAEKFHGKALTFVAFNIDDQTGFGNPWEDFYRNCHAIIFVVDSSDRFNFPHAHEQLHKMLVNPVLRKKHIPILIFANKMDQPGSMSSLQCTQLLDLDKVTKPWQIESTDALTGDGFNEAFDWLAHKLREIHLNP